MQSILSARNLVTIFEFWSTNIQQKVQDNEPKSFVRGEANAFLKRVFKIV